MNLSERLVLYVIPDRNIGAPLSVLQQAEQAIEGGATAIQLRDKSVEGRELYLLAGKLAEMCKRRNVLFIVNDRLDIAIASGADGVHIGQSDIPCEAVRRLVSHDFIVGVSAGTVPEAQEAEREGADYLGVGAVFHTGSKSNADVIGSKVLAEIAASTKLPVVAIGGIDGSNARLAIDSGACGVSVISAIVGKGSVSENAAKMRRIIEASLR